MRPANFAPVAGSAPLYGACRPGHFRTGLAAWTDLLETAGVSRVVCLLSETEARRWGIPDDYADRFEAHHVPILDRQLPSPDRLETAVSLVDETINDGERAAVHCNAGLGRTGVVAAGWLVRARGYEPDAAIDTVEAAGRSPREAVACDNATEAELYALLESSR